jgi:hypothetical protein
MRFKAWLEDSMTAGSQCGNDLSPEDNGLRRQQLSKKSSPDSPKARKIFGIKKSNP